MYKKPEPTVKSYSSKKSRKPIKPDSPQKTDAKSIKSMKSTKSKRGRPRKTLDDSKSVKSTKTMRSTRTLRSTKTKKSTKTMKSSRTLRSARKESPKKKPNNKAMSVKSMPTSEKPTKRSYKRRRPPTPAPPKMKRKYVRKSMNKDLRHSVSMPTLTTNPLLQQSIESVDASTPLRMPFKTNGVIDRRPSNGPASAIKMRINYNKDTPSSSFRASAFAINHKQCSTPLNGITRLSTANNSGCANCSKYSGLNDSMLTNVSLPQCNMLPMMMASNGGSCNREEFYKYLGIDTNPSMQEKTTSPPQQTSPSDAAYNHRRSMRVFIQQRQNEFLRLSKSPDKSAQLQSPPPPRTKYNGTSAAHNVSASPSDSMKRRCALDNDLRMDATDLVLSTSCPAMSTSANGIEAESSASNLISSHIKQRRSYNNQSTVADGGNNAVNNGARNLPNNLTNSTEHQNGAPTKVMMDESINDVATGETSSKPSQSPAPMNRLNSRRDSLDRTRLLRSQKRKVILPSPMMLTEMFKRYKQCFRQGFAMQKQLRQHMKNMAKAPTTDADAQNQLNGSVMADIDLSVTNQQNDSRADASVSTANATEFPNLSSCDDDLTDTHLITPSNSSLSVNSKSNNLCTDTAAIASVSQVTMQPPPPLLPPPPPPPPSSKVTLSSSDSIQWNRDLTKRADKVQFQNPLDPMHGAVLAILTHSTSPSEDDVIVVVQEKQITYFYSTAKVLCMFGIARSWIRVSSIARVVTGI